MRIGVYIDGYNLYYGGRGLCGRSTPGWRWLDLKSLASDLITAHTKGYRAGKLAGEHTDGVGNHWWYQMQPSDWYAHQLPPTIDPRHAGPT